MNITPEMMNEYLPLILKVALGLCLVITFAVLFYQMKKSRTLQTAAYSLYDKLDKQDRFRKKHTGHKVEADKNTERLNRIDEELEYSGLKRMFPFLNAEFVVVVLVSAAALVFFAIQALAHSFLGAVLGAAIVVLLYKGLTSMLCYRNYSVTEEQLPELLNLLKNYSVSTNEITLIFYRVSRYMKDPIKSVLRECYYEAQTTGNASGALVHCANKLEHPKFKEMIRNIEICGRYDADFEAILSVQRKTIQNYVSAKKEQKAANKIDRWAFIIIFCLGLGALGLMGGVMGIDVFHELMYSTSGKLLLLAMGMTVVVYLWVGVLFDK